jgi:hypothetical protein
MGASLRPRGFAPARALPLALLAALASPIPGVARAQNRDVVLPFLPPADPDVTGYRVYISDLATQLEHVFDIGLVQPDADGVARTILTLDAADSYVVGMTAYNARAESELSNQIEIRGEACDAALCDDANPCTADSCGPAGCSSAPLPEGSACDDGYVDTLDDRCFAGRCVGVSLACREDLDCDDGNACNGSESCEAGIQCLVGTPPDCGVATQCADPVCFPDSGCQWVARADGTACDDGLAATSGDACLAGVCQGSAAEALSVAAVVPQSVSGGRQTLEIRGSGFVIGAVLSFENGAGRSPEVRSLLIVDSRTLRADIDVYSKGPRRARFFDVVVTLPGSREARLAGGLRIDP